MVSFTNEEIHAVLKVLPQPVVRMLRMSGLFLAGGFIRAVVAGEKPSDIDIFSPTREKAEYFATRLTRAMLHTGYFKTPNALTVNLPDTPVQFITRWLFALPQQVLDSFDFTIAQAVVYYDMAQGKWVGFASEEFEPDTRGKILRYTSPVREEDAAGSLLRVNKFLSRGYTISDEDLAKVVARVGIEANRKLAEQAENFEPQDAVQVYTKVIKGARPSGGGSV